MVAETFLVAWRRLDELPEEAKPWLLGVARRVLSNQRRAAGRRNALTERVADTTASEQEPAERPAVFQALARLSDSDRELLLLVAWDGLSIREAATTLRCTRDRDEGSPSSGQAPVPHRAPASRARRDRCTSDCTQTEGVS